MSQFDPVNDENFDPTNGAYKAVGTVWDYIIKFGLTNRWLVFSFYIKDFTPPEMVDTGKANFDLWSKILSSNPVTKTGQRTSTISAAWTSQIGKGIFNSLDDILNWLNYMFANVINMSVHVGLDFPENTRADIFTIAMHIKNWEPTTLEELMPDDLNPSFIDSFTGIILDINHSLILPVIDEVSVKFLNKDLSEIYLFPEFTGSWTKDGKGVKLSGVIVWIIIILLLGSFAPKIGRLLVKYSSTVTSAVASYLSGQRLKRMELKEDMIIDAIDNKTFDQTDYSGDFSSIISELQRLVSAIGLKLGF